MKLAVLAAGVSLLVGTPAATISTVAQVAHPRGLQLLPDGGFLVAEPFANLVQRVGADGSVTTVAGTGVAGYSGDGGPATQAELNLPHGVAPLPDGSFLIADTLNNRIRRVAPDGTISTVVGNGLGGFAGDGGPALNAEIDNPRGIATLADGSILFPDSGNNRVRLVSPAGSITTAAGNGTAGFAGDGGSAAAAELNTPFGAAPLPGGGFLVTDHNNDRIRRVSADGLITTVAGDDGEGFSGDGGPAINAALDLPHAAVPLPDGGFLIADTGNDRVRRVWPDGHITTVAGDGVEGFGGDGGPAAAAALDQPKAIAVLPDESGFLVGDAANDRVRLVAIDLRVLAVKLVARLRGRVSATVVRYTLSLSATVRLQVRLRGRLVLGLRLPGKAGANSIAFHLKNPGSYDLLLSADTGDGRTASARATLQVTR